MLIKQLKFHFTLEQLQT